MMQPNSSFKIDVAEQRPDRSSSPRMIRSPTRDKKQNHKPIPVATDFFNSLLGCVFRHAVLLASYQSHALFRVHTQEWGEGLFDEIRVWLG
jgi:hypothetical protein